MVFSRILSQRGMMAAVVIAVILATFDGLSFAVAAGLQGPSSAPISDQQTKLRVELAQTDIRWIAARTGWTKLSIPTIENRSAEQLAIMFFGDSEGINGLRPLALYSRSQHTLYLANEIALESPSDRSILLHELVHHLQILNDVQLGCREEAEAQAYGLQIQWLREQGISDPYALLGLSQDEIGLLRCQ